MSLTLGIDASTTCAGYGVSDQNGKIIDAGFVDLKKHNKNPDKTFHFISVIDKKPWIKNISSINVEAALTGGMRGRTKQQILIMLARFNAVFCYILEQHYHMEPKLADASTMRKQLFGKAWIKGVKPKEFVKQNIEAKYDLTPWVVLNKNKVPDVRMDDVRDGLVACFYRP